MACLQDLRSLINLPTVTCLQEGGHNIGRRIATAGGATRTTSRNSMARPIAKKTAKKTVKKTPKVRKSSNEPVLIDLALQGGGSHGAFTWGVLDRAIQ